MKTIEFNKLVWGNNLLYITTRERIYEAAENIELYTLDNEGIMREAQMYIKRELFEKGAIYEPYDPDINGRSLVRMSRYDETEQKKPFIPAEWGDQNIVTILDGETRKYIISPYNVLDGVCREADNCEQHSGSIERFFEFITTKGDIYYIRQVIIIDVQDVEPVFNMTTREQFEKHENKNKKKNINQ